MSRPFRSARFLLRQIPVSAAALRQWSPRRQVGAMKSFLRYAQAFERAYAAQDWSLLADCIDEQASWSVGGVPPPVGGAFHGRDAVIEAIDRSCTHFDRRFDQRLPRASEGPVPIPGGIYMGWSVTYRREGLPDLVLHGQEWDFFEDGRLVHHRETFANAPEALDYIARHHAALLPGAA